jgi:acyl-coenzyme A synthetase/AMP-(fatty) acid ligase
MTTNAAKKTAGEGRNMSILLGDLTERWPYNAVADFVDANVAGGRGGRMAFKDPARTLTYQELQTETCRCAGGLRALGLRAESRVVLLMLDTVEK